jgi:hypothetical protein
MLNSKLDSKVVKNIFSPDSTILRGYINFFFFGNRLSVINENSTPKQCHHVDSFLSLHFLLYEKIILVHWTSGKVGILYKYTKLSFDVFHQELFILKLLTIWLQIPFLALFGDSQIDEENRRMFIVTMLLI